MTDKVDMSESAWRARLAPEQHHVPREKGTERAFTDRYQDTGPLPLRGLRPGVVLLGDEVHSGRGWPRFMQPVQPSAARKGDRSYGTVGTECSAPGVTGRAPRRAALRREWWLSRRDRLLRGDARLAHWLIRRLGFDTIGPRPANTGASAAHGWLRNDTGCSPVGVPRTTGEAVRQ
jgi:hypothetical protein